MGPCPFSKKAAGSTYGNSWTHDLQLQRRHLLKSFPNYMTVTDVMDVTGVVGRVGLRAVECVHHR